MKVSFHNTHNLYRIVFVLFFPAFVQAMNISESGSLDADEWQFYPVEVPEDAEGWRIVLHSNEPGLSLRLREGQEPTTSSLSGLLFSGSGGYTSTIHRQDSQLDAGTWYIGVYNDSSETRSFTIYAQEQIRSIELNWDDGNGSNAYVVEGDGTGGVYYFTIETQNTALGAWRQALQVTNGEARLLLRQSTPPTTGNNQYDSGVTDFGGGTSRGLSTSGVNPVTWHLMVMANPDTEWSLVAGDMEVVDLSELAASDSADSSIDSVIPGEGAKVFRTEIPQQALAWHLWVKPDADSEETLDNTIYLRETGDGLLPAPDSGGNWGFTTQTQADYYFDGQFLLVPDGTFNPGDSAFYIVVVGDPGDDFHLFSRRHAIESISYDSLTDPRGGDGSWFHSFNLSLPSDLDGWEVTAQALEGDAFVSARQGSVPNADNNLAFSEIEGADSSFSIISDALSGGSTFITVYGIDESPEFRLQNREPLITTLDYEDDITNDEPNRAGWRYYRMDDIDSQAFNWMLELDNASPATQIAIRRNNLPGFRESRQNGGTSQHEQVDEITSLGFLQQPSHDPDIWYVGIYNGERALGEFELNSGPIVPVSLELSDGVTNRPIRPGEWSFYEFVIPENLEWEGKSIKGWNIRLQIPDGELVGMVMQRGQLPENAGSAFVRVGNAESWSTNSRISANSTWSGPTQTYDGGREIGLSFGMGQPLQAGTYFLAVTNGQFNDSSHYTLTASVVGGDGSGLDYEISELAYSDGGGSENVSEGTLDPQDIAYYVVEIPENTRSWRVSLELPEEHEARMFMRKDHLPNLSISTGSNTSNAIQNIYLPLSSPSFNQFGRQVLLDTDGRESFDLWPRSGEEYVDPGTYYILIASQGQNPPANNQSGADAIDYTLICHGEVPVLDLGMIEPGEVELLAGESYLSGEINYYRFEIPEDTLGIQIQLLDKIENPHMRLRKDEIPGNLFQLSGTGSASNYHYGHYSGRPYQWHGGDQLFLTNPDPGVYYLTVAAQNAAQLPAGEYTLNFEAIEAPSIDVDHPEEIAVEGIQPGNWVFYEVEIPEHILGWEVRVTEWETTGNERRPVIALRPELLPEGTSISNSGWTSFLQPRDATAPSWNSSRTIAKNHGEWTGLNRPFEGGLATETYLHSIPMGQPLDSGIYYVGFYLPEIASEPFDFKWTSRAIGEAGSGYSYEVRELEFEDEATGNLYARDVSYYQIEIPNETYLSWHFELLLPEAEDRGDDAQLYVRKDYLPNTESNSTAATNPAAPVSGNQQQLRLNRPGEESFVLWPSNGEEYIEGGTYYLMVVSEGQNPDPGNQRIGEGSIDYRLISHGEYQYNEENLIGALMPGEIVERSDSYLAGQQSYFQFEIPEGIEAVEIRLNAISGNPIMRLSKSDFPPSIAVSSYGHYSGYSQHAANSSLITLTDSSESPLAGNYTLMVVHAQNSDHEAAEFEITIADTGPQLVENIDGYSDTDVTIGAGEWTYYRLTVPEKLNGHDLLGWELRITDWEGDEPPAMVIRRDELPDSVSPSGSISRSGSITNWNSGARMVVSSSLTPNRWNDWTWRSNSADGDPYEGIALALPMGQPLQPGEYYIGFRSRLGSIGPITFSWDSAAIGLEGSGMTHEVAELPFDSDVSETLQPREVAHYYVDIPENTSNWQVSLDLEEGHEAVVYIRGTRLPLNQSQSNSHNNPADWSRAENISITSSIGPHVFLDNPGNKTFTLWPESNEEYIEAGRYFITVAAIGQDAEDDESIGVGETEYALSNGPVPVTQIEGTLHTGDIVGLEDQSFTASTFNYYQFEVGEDNRALEVRMSNRVGEPRLQLRKGEVAPRARFNVTWNAYGQYSGHTSAAATDDILVLPELDSGIYTLVVGHGASPGYGEGAYDLSVSSLEPQPIGFGAGVRFATGSLVQGQRDFYAVEVEDTVEFREPESAEDREVIGWRIRIEEASGNTQFRVRKGNLPEGTTSSATQSNWFTGSMLVVPPFLVDGDWYIEVNGLEASDYTISSEVIVLSSMEHYWTMPEVGESPDVARFGNTQSDIDSEGMHLDAGDYHLYAFEVPENNGGLLRTVLEKISGDELSLYLRPHALPTSSHGEESGFGTTRLHLVSGSSTTQYGNWVPRHLLTEDQIEPGIWFAKVQSTGASASYHLRLDHNAADRVKDLDLDGGSFENQTLVGTDWRYYRVQLPEEYEDTPDEWNITFSDPAENVVMYIRETIPPGLWQNTNIGSSLSYHNPRDWTQDGYWTQNRYGTNRRFTSPGTYTLDGNMLRPGQTYYLGFRASDATTFSVSSNIGSETIEATYGAFGLLSGTGGLVELDLEAGEVKTWQVDFPAEAIRWRSLMLNDSSVDFYLGHHGQLPLIQSSGNYAASNGSQNWEFQSSLFPTSFRNGKNTFYLTAVNSSSETQPIRIFVDWRDAEDFEIDFTIEGEGSVATTPESYQTGDSVEILATAEPGWVFAGWSGDVSSNDNPLSLTLFDDLSLTASFEELEGAYVMSAEVITEKVLMSEGSGEIITVEYTVTNTGSSVETVSPIFELDSGQEIWTLHADSVEIAPGESDTILFEYDLASVNPESPYSAVYSVVVNGVNAGTFNGLYLEAEAYWSGRGYDEIELGDYEEIGYRVYPLPNEDVEVDIVVLANDDILETDTLSVSQGTYTPSWTWYVWYGDEPGEFEVTVNGFVAVNSPVVFYDPSDPGDPGDPDFDGIVEIVNTSYSTGRFPGEQVFVYAFVRETTGEDTGQISVDFSVEGEFISSQTVEVDAGETLQVTFSNFFEEPGTYQATLNDEEFEIVVETPQIDVELDNFRVSSSEVYSGQFVRVSVDAENIDDTAGEFEVEFKMYDLIGGPLSDGPVEIRAEAISGYLKPSESGTLDFHYHFEFAGEFHVEIEDFTPIEITVTNGWPQYGHGHGNRKSGALDAPMFNMDTLWSYAAGDESFHYVRSSPVVVDGVVYVGSWPPALHAVDAETGELVWDEPFATSSAVVNAPAVAGGRVFVTTGGAGGADLHAVDAETGNEIWTTEGLGDVHLTAPIVVDGIVYVGSDDGYLHAVDVADGDILWSYDAEAEIHSTPAYANGIVYFGSDGSVHAIDALSGTLAWEEPYNSVFVRSATTVVQLFSTGEWVVLVGTLNGEVHAIDADSGEAYWAEPFEVDGNIHASPVEAGQDVYVATDTGFVYQIDGLTGEASGWDSAFEADGGIVGSPFYANSRIHFGTIEGTFYAVPGFVAEPQPVWTYSIGSPLRSSPAVWDEVIYIGADDAKLYALYSLGEDHVPGVPPAIVEQPQSIIAEHLATVSFRVVAGGDEPLNYQWMFEEDPLDGAESNMLVLTDISMSNVGEYSVVVSNEVGSETSEAVRLDIQSSFTMDAELPDTVMVDEAADISVDLSADVQGSVGYPEVSYAIGISGPGPVNVEWEGESTSLGDGIDKWFSDTLFAVGAEFSESSNWALTFMSEGSYEITFAAYSVETQRDPVEEQIASVTKTVSVNDWMAPLITENPQSQTVDHGDSIHFNVIADGDGDLQYRWYKDSEPITDLVDSHQYTISSATSASEGIYSVEVVSPYGTAFSSNATLVVMLPESLPETLGDAEQESENFYQSSWLGRFFTGDASGGWINHESLGWFFVYSGATQGSVWLWDPVSNSNFYTDQTLYTFFYSDTYGWVYYHSDVSSSSGSRWFQRADDSEVINLETLPGPFQE